jgi:hypothetical protein
MTTGRVRLTRRGWAAIAVAGIVALGGLTVLVSRSGPPDCTVRVDDGTVELDREEAERATTAVALAVIGGTGSPGAAGVVRDYVSLSSEEDRAVAEALSGQERAALTCRHGGASTTESDSVDAHGLTGRAAALRTDLRGRFRSLPLGGFAPGGVSTGHMAGSTHYEGRAIDVFFRPTNGANRARGWVLAHYLVAHADRLAIDTVIFDDRIWTARRADEGWRDYRIDVAGKSRATARVLEHRDHVHVDVAD